MKKLFEACSSYISQRKLVYRIKKKLPESIINHIIEYYPGDETLIKNSSSFSNLKFVVLVITYQISSYFIGSLFTGRPLSMSMILINLLIGYFLLIVMLLLLSILMLLILGRDKWDRIIKFIL